MSIVLFLENFNACLSGCVNTKITYILSLFQRTSDEPSIGSIVHQETMMRTLAYTIVFL